MKILVVLNSLSLGGIEVMFLRALPFLKQAGLQVDFALHEHGHILDKDFEALGCRLWKLSKRANPLKTAQDLSRLLSAHDYDILHSQFGYSAGGHALGAHKASVPAIVSFHSASPTSLYSWEQRPILGQLRWMWLQWHRRLILKYATEIVGHSHCNLQAFLPNWEQAQVSCRVIENAVSFPEPLEDKTTCRSKLALDQEALILLHVGSLRLVKNHGELFQILKALHERGERAQLLLVGDGELRQKLYRQVSEMGLQKHVQFAGLVPEPWDYYRAADVFVFPSKSEGFANALVEAQGCGLPIVASKIPAHLESVDESQQHFLYPLGDIPTAVQAILEQKDARESSWLKSSQEKVRKRFTIERFAADLAKLYWGSVPDPAKRGKLPLDPHSG